MIRDDKLYYAEEDEEQDEDPRKVKEWKETSPENISCIVFNSESVNFKWFSINYDKSTTVLIIK